MLMNFYPKVPNYTLLLRTLVKIDTINLEGNYSNLA